MDETPLSCGINTQTCARTHALMVWMNIPSITKTENIQINIIHRLMCMHINNIHSSRIVNILVVGTFT